MKINYIAKRAKELPFREVVYRGSNVIYEAIFCKLYKMGINRYFYCSFWHGKIFRKRQETNQNGFLVSRANPRAGIGHKIANWISGYWFAELFNLNFAHIPFCDSYAPNSENSWWESFLGLGEGEQSLSELKHRGYKIVRLPKFDEKKSEDIDMIRRIIKSYGSERIIFKLEQDTFNTDCSVAIEAIRDKFYRNEKRKDDKTVFDSDCFNVAIHVRRNVVINNRTIDEPDEIKARRYTGVEYYINVLTQIVQGIKINRKIKIFLFSQADPAEFDILKQFGDVKYCYDMDEKESFLHMVYADLLITSKSSFSYSAAILSNGLVIGIPGYWQTYPESDRWFVPDSNGNLNTNDIRNLQNQIEGEK